MGGEDQCVKAGKAVLPARAIGTLLVPLRSKPQLQARDECTSMMMPFRLFRPPPVNVLPVALPTDAVSRMVLLLPWLVIQAASIAVVGDNDERRTSVASCAHGAAGLIAGDLVVSRIV